MNAQQVLIQGTLKADGTLELEESPTLPAGPVEVLIRAKPQAGAESENWWEFLQKRRAELLAQGHIFRSRDEIHADRERLWSNDEKRRDYIQRFQAASE